MKTIAKIAALAGFAALAACGGGNDEAAVNAEENLATDMNAGMTDLNATMNTDMNAMGADNATVVANNVTVVEGGNAADANATANAMGNNGM